MNALRPEARPGGDARREPPIQRPYDPPQLRLLGTFAELTRGVNGQSDGLGPGSSLP